MSTQQQALQLAKETLSELFKETKTSAILRRCLAISNLVGDTEAQKWIKTESSWIPQRHD